MTDSSEFLKTVAALAITLILSGFVVLGITWLNAMLTHRIPVRRGFKKQQSGDFEGAEQEYTRLLAKHPDYIPAALGRAWVYVRQYDYAPALADLDHALTLNPRCTGAYILRGMVHFSQSRFDEAVIDCDQALTYPMHRPQKAFAYFYRGFAKLNRYEASDDADTDRALLDSANADFKEALRLNPKSYGAVAGIALVLKQKGDYASAFATYEDALRIYPDEPELYVDRSSLYLSQKNYAAARADCMKAIQIRPKYELAYNGLGYTYSLLGAFDKALAACNQAINLNARLHLAYGSRGHTYFLMGQFAEALGDFEQSAQLKPDHTFALAGQAICYHALGHSDLAKTAWQSLLAVDARYQNPERLQTSFTAPTLSSKQPAPSLSCSRGREIPRLPILKNPRTLRKLS